MKKIFILFVLTFTLNIVAQTEQPDEHTVALYLFNKGEGDTLFDYSGHNLNGILKNQTDWVNGGGISFNGSNYIEIPHNNLLNPGNGSWTVEIVFATDINKLKNDSPTKTNSILTKNDEDFGNGYNIHFNWGKKKVFALMDDNTNQPQNSLTGTDFEYISGTHHLAMVYDKDSSKLSIYLDDKFGSSVKTNMEEITPEAPLFIGKYNQTSQNYTQYFKGIVYKIRISDIVRNPDDFITSIKENNKQKGERFKFALNQNYPNPFNPSTKITFSLDRREHVVLKIFNILGQEITELINAEKPKGFYSINFNAENLPSGIYFYNLKTKNNSIVKSMVLQK